MPLPSFSLPRPLWLSWLAVIIIALYGVTLLSEFFAPVLWDDIWFPVMNSRAGFDGWYAMNTYPQCGGTFLTAIPLTLLPGRAISWLAHVITGNFFTMRASSIVILLAWISYAVWFLRTLFLPNAPGLLVAAGVIAFAGLGTLPYAMLMSRPERGMIFVVTFYASLPFIIRKYPDALLT